MRISDWQTCALPILPVPFADDRGEGIMLALAIAERRAGDVVERDDLLQHEGGVAAAMPGLVAVHAELAELRRIDAKELGCFPIDRARVGLSCGGALRLGAGGLLAAGPMGSA